MNVAKLKGAITAAGYTQNSLAEKMGKSKSSFNRKVNGLTPFDIFEVQELCELLALNDSDIKVEIFLT